MIANLFLGEFLRFKKDSHIRSSQKLLWFLLYANSGWSIFTFCPWCRLFLFFFFYILSKSKNKEEIQWNVPRYSAKIFVLLNCNIVYVTVFIHKLGGIYFYLINQSSSVNFFFNVCLVTANILSYKKINRTLLIFLSLTR